ncbi:hypothetical protein HD596_002544 [Nonomuraea jabiensis]|uniref:Uncharacterized protein n=1 Tax=Nonomuraea jabiensis TaxID=882448 RepID=A0A7W9G239_9ACTN|nr:hypothetical protein [Nonomuraea jabiensis]
MVRTAFVVLMGLVCMSRLLVFGVLSMLRAFAVLRVTIAFALVMVLGARGARRVPRCSQC